MNGIRPRYVNDGTIVSNSLSAQKDDVWHNENFDLKLEKVPAPPLMLMMVFFVYVCS